MIEGVGVVIVGRALRRVEEPEAAVGVVERKGRIVGNEEPEPLGSNTPVFVEVPKTEGVLKDAEVEVPDCCGAVGVFVAAGACVVEAKALGVVVLGESTFSSVVRRDLEGDGFAPEGIGLMVHTESKPAILLLVATSCNILIARKASSIEGVWYRIRS